MNQQEAIKRLNDIYHTDSCYVPLALLNSQCLTVWSTRKEGTRVNKIPINGKSGRWLNNYNDDDFKGFLSFDECLSAMKKFRLKGIGVLPRSCENLVIIDLDHCIKYDESTGTWEWDRGMDPEKRNTIETFFSKVDGRTYIELSQSKSGLHVVCNGHIPRNVGHGKDRPAEMYHHKAFVALTFQPEPHSAVEISDCQNAINWLYEKCTESETNNTIAPTNQIPVTSFTAEWSDDEIINRIKRVSPFRNLFNGDLPDKYMKADGTYDRSSIEFAAIEKLLFYTDGDTERTCRIMDTDGLGLTSLGVDRWAGRSDHMKEINKCLNTMTSFYSTQQEERIAAAFSSDPDEDAPRFSRCPRNPDTDKTFSAELLAVLKYLDPADNKSKFKGGDDIALGKLYATVYKSIARYNTTAKCWYLFNGTVWLPDQGNKTAGLLAQLLQKGLTGYLYQIPPQDDRQNYIKVIGKLGNHNQREKMLQDAAMYTHFKTEELDSNPDMLNCLNGVYDLANHTFSPDHDADLLLSKCSNIIYDPEASSEKWDAFINDALENNTEKISFLKRALGLALTENISEECFFILLGTQTRNGKSTCLETLGYALGDYSESAAPETFAKQARRSSGPSPDRAKLKGCRFLRVSEPDKGMLLDEGFIKQATGGEEISARFLNENEFSFKPKFKLFMNVNNPPVITDMTIFDSDRVHVITFDRFYTAAERDHKLKAKLRKPAAISGLFNWCIEGLKDYELQGLNPPACVVQATASYRDNSDKIKCFFNECMIPDQAGRESLTEVYRAYVAWCTASGYAPGSKRTFKNESKKRGLFLEQGTVKGQTRRNLIIGYRIVAFDED